MKQVRNKREAGAELAQLGGPSRDVVAHQSNSKERRPGRLKGQIRVVKDFDRTPLDVIEGFESA